MSGRRYLKNTVLLCGESDGEHFRRTFTIVRRIDEGASSVCYEAYYGKSGRGVLKEFYPQDSYALKRNRQGQLVLSTEFGDACSRFRRAEKEYLKPYEMLLGVRQHSDDQEVASFIPAFEIYHGCDEDGTIIGTTYIWTPEPKLETFDRVCREIHKHPGRSPEHKLVTVLTAVESLTRCICALHCAGMVHRDIKPSNFGFIRRGNETLTQTLSMFDINSICSVYEDTEKGMGTEGYMEPEARQESATNQTDLYSIGAVLFHAVIVTDETREGGYLYRSEYYGRLRELVDSSRLIRASEANSHPRLRNILTTILQKCLCARSSRYRNCEELLADLETALYYALPSEIARKSLSGEKWVLADVEKSLDANREKNSMLAIQYHLYEHPLYQCLEEGEDTIRVLVIGFGNYGQKFLDACLQAGQIRGLKLDVTILSGDAMDKKLYLADRPELAEFFNIDGSLPDGKDSYGTVTFELVRLERTDLQADAEILSGRIRERFRDRRLHYIFAALGEDSLNLAAARACRLAVTDRGAEAADCMAAGKPERGCVASCVCEGGRIPKGMREGLAPLYVNAEMRKMRLYPEIERMAFNTHLVWEKNLNVDYRSVRADFRKAYNHDSSVSSVLSLKYKLHSLGIELEEAGFDGAARLFCERISGEGAGRVRNELIWIEHRRWVAEKLCLGWRKIQDLEDCAGGVTKDEKRRRHVCIRRSRPDQRLADEFSPSQWDSISEERLGQLDELDQMSVRLHRMYQKKAEEAEGANLLSGNSMAAIRALIGNGKTVIPSFQEWYSCLKDIRNGDRGKVRLYKGLKKAFLDAAEALPEEKRRSLREQVKAFETLFYPILARAEYRDWKQDDAALIDNIPFVLTYAEDICMAVPYQAGNNDALFENAAAATVVNPASLLYLYLAENEKDVRELERSIPYVAEYMRKKRFRAAVDFVIICRERAASAVNRDFAERLRCLGGGRIRRVRGLPLAETEEPAEVLSDFLRERYAGRRMPVVEKNKSGLSCSLQGAGFYREFPCYRFEPASMAFRELSGCDMLRYIRKKPYLTAADLTAFRLSTGENGRQPEFFEDYKELWKRYCSNRSVWKLLCDVLGNYAEKNDILEEFEKPRQQTKEQKPEEYSYILPSACFGGAAKIIGYLKKQDILEPESSVEGYTSDSCRVRIFDSFGCREKYDRLFSRVYVLMLPDAISLYLNSKNRKVRVAFDNLEVSELRIAGGRSAELAGLMRFFRDKGYVLNLVITPDWKMSFTYGTRRVKELLTAAGRLLEVYVYHEAKASGSFDDVVSSYEIGWGGTGAVNEFDCILTRGFQTLFVECKARTALEQEFYFKLSALAEQFGINAAAVLVADTQEEGWPDIASANAVQRKRGSMLHVVTVWKPEEISDIGNTLLRIAEGTYRSGTE